MKLTLNDAFAPTSEAALAALERRTGRTVPRAYRALLLQQNGGKPAPADFSFFNAARGRNETSTVRYLLGVHDGPYGSLERTLATFAGRFPSDLFPIARDPGGNLVLMGTHGPREGRVYFWDHEMEAADGEPPSEANVHLIADSLEGFLGLLR